MKPNHPRPSLAGALVLLLPLVLAAACSSAPPPDTAPDPEAAGQEPVDEPPVGPQQRTGVEPGPVPADLQTRAPAPPAVYGVDLDTIRPGAFDQGKMWTFEFPPVEYLRSEYGLEPDSAWWRKARTAALRIPNCSASLVSADGLVMTNHHCARDFVTQVSGEGENLLDDGFYATSLEEERSVEDFHADQLVEIRDITARVEERTAGLSGVNLVEARENALEEIAGSIQEELGGEDAGWVVEAISLYNGAHFSAYVFRRYENAKLVAAPELQIGFFGGDPDNFTYPRYNLDFSFFRLYDENGEPLETETYFEWAPRGVGEGDPIFIIGNPGTTNRLQTVAQLEFRREVEDPSVLDFVRDRMEAFEEYIEAFPDEAEEHDLRNTLFGLVNQEKSMEGQIEGLHDPVIMARRRAADADLLSSVRGGPDLVDEFGGMFDEMAEIQNEAREWAPGFGAFLGLNSGDLASPTLYRALVAFQVLNLQGRGAPADQVEGLLEELRGVADKPAPLDQALIETRIRDFQQYYGEAPWVEAILEGRTPEGAAAVIHDGSVLSDSAGAVQAVTGGRVSPEDPAIAFVQSYVPAFAEFQGAFAGLGAREEEVARKLGRARFEVYGTSQPPDATFSLRLADGVVSPYEYNGTTAPALTTFYGLYDRFHAHASRYQDSGESPWALPARWAGPPEGLDLSTPVNFVSTADIIGGNSGSPVVNEFLQVVGLVFDGNIESLPGDYIYLPESNRAVAVDARGILEALEAVYGLDRIVEELRSGRLAGVQSGGGGG